MKKLFIAIAFLTIGASTANAQGLKFGVKGGLNLSNTLINHGDLEGAPLKLAEKLEENKKMRIGYHVGVMAEFMLSDVVGIQPELVYSTQGAASSFEASVGASSIETKSTTKLDYINIPVMAKYKPIPGLSLEVGPQVGFLVSAKQTGETTTTIGGKSTTIDVESPEKFKDGFKTVDFGMNFGASYTIMGMNFGARYNLGLSNITKVEDELKEAADKTDFDLGSTKNSVIQISVGYFF